MNRKLINGLLLLTVATGGVGTFTSCKDNEDSFRQETNQAQGQLFKILDDKIKNGEDNLVVVKDKLNALLGAGLLTERNQEYLVDLINNNKNYAEQLKVYVDDMVMNLITNVQIEEVYNPAFGTINLPLGIQNGLLCNYYYQSDHAVQFPIANGQQFAGMGVYGDPDALRALDESGLTPEGTVTLGTEVQDIKRLGEIYVTVNPSTVPVEALKDLKITLNKTNGEQVLGVLQEIDKEDEHVKYFGYTRANNNGFYKIKVGVVAADVPTINLNLDDNLKEAAKDFVKSPSKSDLLGLAEAIYKQFNNRIPALGLKFEVPVAQSFNYQSTPWSSAPGGLLLPNVEVGADGKYTTKDNNVVNDPEGNKGTSGEVASDPNKNPILRAVMSPYDIAVVTYHPLSYSFDPEGYVPDRRLPQIGHIQSIVDRVLDKVNFELNLGIDTDEYDFSFNLEDVNFEVKPDALEINLGGTPVYDKSDYDKDGNLKPGSTPMGFLGDEANIKLEYNGTNVENPYKDALNPLVDAIVNAVNGEGGFKDQLQTQVESQLIDQVNKLVADLNDQLKSVNTTISDKITSIKEEINNELSGRLGDGINRLIDLYNKLAEKVNTILDDPNAYMQVYAAYRDGNGDLHHLSTVASDPSLFTPGTGDAITLFLTSYNGELLAPAYKKYVAVVKDLTDGSSIADVNKADYLNKVLDGRQQKTYIPVNALKAGHTYQVVYTALDYRGNVSARSFYIKVAK